MTNKELLFKDLCCRLPYGVKVESCNDKGVKTIETLYNIDADGYICTIECDTFKNIKKPYLFPMSSMTKEQIDDYTIFISNGVMKENIIYDWLNKNHFDYRGLIDKSLAIDATGLNIY